MVSQRWLAPLHCTYVGRLLSSLRPPLQIEYKTTSETPRLVVPLPLRRVAIALAVTIAVLVVTGAAANWMIYNLFPPEHPIADVLRRLDLGHEPSIPAFYSAVMMLCCAGLLYIVGRSAQRLRQSWLLLAFVFLFMALDEAVMFHEMVDTGVKMFVPTSGPFYFAWVLPGMAVVVAFGLLFLRLLSSLEHPTRTYFLASGIIFVSGAIGMEMVAGVIFDNAVDEAAALRSLSHVLSQAVEEGLEMIGIAMFFVALLDYAQRKHGGIQFLLQRPSDAAEPTGDDEPSKPVFG